MQALGRFFSNILFYGGLVALIAGAFYVFMPKYRQMSMLEHQRNELMRKIDYVKNVTADLKIRQKRFENDAEYVEYIARQHRRVRNNEFLFIVVND